MKPDDNPLIEVTAVVEDAVLDVRYATARNFLGQPVYPQAEVFLKRSTALKLEEAAKRLRKGGYRLVVFDGYRPLSVQKKMWSIKPDRRFVADPAKGSHHNRGGAVDVGLADLEGGPVEMPSDFDEFGPRASGLGASPAAVKNLLRLRAAMEGAGFKALQEEWWHFHDPECRSWPLLDLDFEQIPRSR
ncbi:MAG: M15 family metallopeptidase [Elusimicrobia bacterium]|nr:M15 family metallopeptidase [Elusimicrobiota bacterium]